MAIIQKLKNTRLGNEQVDKERGRDNNINRNEDLLIKREKYFT